LAVARQVLSEHFGDEMALYAFKVSPKGDVYLRLDKLTNKGRNLSIMVSNWSNQPHKEKLNLMICVQYCVN
jgi:hypothetical protein